ncbi:transposase [Azohydromonas lata]|uniref:Transposase n=1 Tax=Azohydromonas lata TaxID=45677 RepID=A0ABU5IS64_9BURK|nr:transposase [Azohydromonas lata]MDZ5461732.1 transposase [Azohydromonas lata]
MQPKSQRRVHGAEFKAQVLAECEQPGASVAAIALAHGLNVNLLRKWLVGRGIKRTGLPAPRTTATRALPAAGELAAAAVQFIPVEFESAAPAADEATTRSTSDIHVELTRGGTLLCVRWPATHAASCAVWLQELAATALKE